MSHRATNWAIQQRGLDPATKLLLWYLADCHNGHTGRCDPSQEVLSYECEMSRASVNRHLKKLEDAGLIRRVQRTDKRTKRQLSTYYVLALDDDKAESQDDTRPVSQSDTRAVSQIEQEPCLKSDESRVSNCDTNLGREPGREPGTAREARSPSQKKSRKVAEAEVHAVLCEVISPQLASDFIEHRTGLRKPLTKRAAELIRDKLKACPFPAAAVEASIENGWQGVFPERGQAPAQSGDSAEAAQIERYRRMRG